MCSAIGSFLRQIMGNATVYDWFWYYCSLKQENYLLSIHSARDWGYLLHARKTRYLHTTANFRLIFSASVIGVRRFLRRGLERHNPNKITRKLILSANNFLFKFQISRKNQNKHNHRRTDKNIQKYTTVRAFTQTTRTPQTLLTLFICDIPHPNPAASESKLKSPVLLETETRVNDLLE